MSASGQCLAALFWAPERDAGYGAIAPGSNSSRAKPEWFVRHTKTWARWILKGARKMPAPSPSTRLIPSRTKSMCTFAYACHSVHDEEKRLNGAEGRAASPKQHGPQLTWFSIRSRSSCFLRVCSACTHYRCRGRRKRSIFSSPATCFMRLGILRSSSCCGSRR